ncbi:hypothetical protein Patl1_08200 [Pistacia atlantica]|uniref:Uncharacterized protein n=1 Tax=Pistacia atlantica TaxID=434234 RepID=A0ACC1AJV0_9ROSI|nr:hypothetical protein Patl1_08200 [Pistacia atlantica]
MAGNAATVLKHLLHKSPTLPPPNKTLTNTILTHLEANRLREAVSVLFASPDPVPHSLYAQLFNLCSSQHAIVEGRKVESHLVTICPTPPTFLLNRAVLGNMRVFE